MYGWGWGEGGGKRKCKDRRSNNIFFLNCGILEQGKRKWPYLRYISKRDSTVFVNMWGRSVKEWEKLSLSASLWPEQQERWMLFPEKER